jgi:hypothetical protein
MLAGIVLAIGIGFIPTSALAEPATQIIATATTTISEPVASDPTVKPDPAQLSNEQKQELAHAGFVEIDIDVYYRADSGKWVKDSRGREVLTEAWVTARTFKDADGNRVTLKDDGYIDAIETSVPTGTFILTDVSLAPKGGMDFWCGYSLQAWTVQNLLNDANRQRDNVNSGSTDTFVPELSSGDTLEVASDHGAWCFTAATKA